MSAPAESLQALLCEEIPLCRALQVRVERWQDHQLCLSLPLAANGNPHGTQFGGSLYCGALLAGWGWLHLRLRELGLQGVVVIKDAQVSYLLPVDSDALACCQAPEPEAWEQFLTSFRRRGRARLLLLSEVRNALGEVAVRFSGQFVLQR